jgi:hypothetical protein
MEHGWAGGAGAAVSAAIWDRTVDAEGVGEAGPGLLEKCAGITHSRLILRLLAWRTADVQEMQFVIIPQETVAISLSLTGLLN